MMTKLAIIGYGNMGKLIHQLAESAGFEVVAIIDPVGHTPTISPKTIGECDVCIDFSLPNAVSDNLRQIAACGKDCVVGTTSWYDNLPDVVSLFSDSGLVWGSNFSLGMNAFFLMVEQAASIINELDNYDVFGIEQHHKQKVDSPSGTAKSIADILLSKIDRKNTAYYDKLNRRPQPDEIHFASVRGGAVPGTHTISFDSAADTIELTHRARNRHGFALGALRAAKWIRGKNGVYEFRQIFREILHNT
ncbi:MAG: 4-hydroxy-tetrahydrodipicolinate reductase [Candidatus Cloacimonetes bacterium]|nr:4-hydroxy-tetrahydrodipicolinate reductase [Candidatus Cloacimonadota bacterium]